MIKKSLIILLIIISGLGIFGSKTLAQSELDPPDLLKVAEVDIGEIQATVRWTWSGDATQITHFDLYYQAGEEEVNYGNGDSGKEKCKDITNWGTAEGVGKNERDKQIFGLVPATWYCWKMRAVAIEGGISSGFAYGEPFFTNPSTAEENGTGGNGPGNGWAPIIPIPLKNPLEAETLWEAIDYLANFLLVLAFGIAPLLIIYAAFLLLFYRDDPKAINRAKTVILWTLIALSLILFAKGLPIVMKEALGG